MLWVEWMKLPSSSPTIAVCRKSSLILGALLENGTPHDGELDVVKDEFDNFSISLFQEILSNRFYVALWYLISISNSIVLPWRIRYTFQITVFLLIRVSWFLLCSPILRNFILWYWSLSFKVELCISDWASHEFFLDYLCFLLFLSNTSLLCCIVGMA